MNPTAAGESTQIELAKKLLKTVRHAAYATINEDGTPHNSPLMLIYNETLTKLYVGSYSASQHSQNFVRTGNAFAVLFDSFVKGQGGVYITCTNAHECVGDELTEAVRVHNLTRARWGSTPIDISFYQADEPSQRMYSLDVFRIEIYQVLRGEDGIIMSESRAEVHAKDLLGG